MRRLDALQSVPEENFREAVTRFRQDFGLIADDEYDELVLLRRLRQVNERNRQKAQRQKLNEGREEPQVPRMPQPRDQPPER